jgi:hypothetical protein
MLSLSYGIQVSANGYLGTSLRFLNQSALIDPTSNQVVGGGSAVGADLGFLQNIYLKDDYEKVRFGVSIQNIGSKLNGNLYQPMNFSLGASYSDGYYDADKYSMQDFAWLAGFQLDKPLIPTMPITDQNGTIVKGKNPNRSPISNLFTTWSDSPLGFSDNIKQVRYTVFAETMFNKRFSLRGGYCYEDPQFGDRNYLAFGAGINWAYQESDYTVNLAVTQPMGKNASVSPLRNSFSLQFLFQFGKR